MLSVPLGERQEGAGSIQYFTVTSSSCPANITKNQLQNFLYAQLKKYWPWPKNFFCVCEDMSQVELLASKV